jgi:hypothetical protein
MSKARYYIYRNIKTLNTSNHCSIRYKQQVVDRQSHIRCFDVDFVIQPAGSQRAKQERVRNVHAFVSPIRYEALRKDQVPDLTNLRKITYHPFELDTFIYKDTNEPVHRVKECIISNGKIYVVE